jgi:hypothetical protein
MFIFPGRLYATDEYAAIEEVYRQIAVRGFKLIGEVSLTDHIPQANKLTWYEFYVKVEEIS